MNLRVITTKFLDRLRKSGIAFYRKYSLPRWLVLIIDISVVFISFFIACLLRYNFTMGSVSLFQFTNQALVALAAYLFFMIVFQSYTGLLRHTTVKDISSIFMANTSAAALLILMSAAGRGFLWNRAFVISLSILLIHYVLVTVLHSLVRISIKTIFESVNSPQNSKKNVVIFGAGILGVTVKRIIESDHSSGFRISGYLDDNRKLRGKTVDQHPIWSPGVLDRKFVKVQNIKTVILAINEFPAERKAIIIKKALSLDLEVLEVPSADTWLQGKLSLRQIQRVKPEDLLGRPPIELNTARIFDGLDGKTVLVTGAAGSIGSEMVRQLARFLTVKLVLVDQAETPSFYLKGELERDFPNVSFKTIIADVTNYAVMDNIFRTYSPEIVFHAAAYKHVPLMEENPRESVRVNIGGTKIVADLSNKYGVEKFIMISSDKAVNPANVMGASKRLCELYVYSLCRNKNCRTQFVTTRFGNVLGSNGSVIPIFKRQIESGGPVTVTHQDITRFFMTIPEACQLVLEAAFMGHGGEIFVFDMGSPVRIYDLAVQMIKLSGLVPGEDIKIEITGLRPGEKLFEELLSDKEKTRETYHPKIMIAGNGKDLDTALEDKVSNLLKTLYERPDKEVVGMLKKLVPEFRSETKEKLEEVEK
jgi:FlaA1/EpsC-like NDP-sugar epimerase